MSRRLIVPGSLIALLILLQPLADAAAQGVQYKETTKVSIGGGLGFIARLAGMNSTSTTYITENGQRSDEGDERSEVIDLEQGHFLSLDHKRKTYTVMRFSDMAAMAERAMEQVQEAREEVEADVAQAEAEARDAQAESNVEFDFDIQVDRTGRRANVNGADAEQVVMVVRTDVKDKSQPEEESGSFYLVSDGWYAKALPGQATMEAFYRKMGETMGHEFMETDVAPGIMDAMQSDARMAPAMERAQEELSQLEGTPVRTTMHMVIVEYGKELDVDKLLGSASAAAAEAEEEKPRRRGLGGLLKKAQELAASEPEQTEQQDQSQATLLTVVTEMSDFQTSSIDPSIFSIPPAYRQVSLGQN